MVLFLLTAFIAVPLIEIAVFIQVGGEIGLGATLAVIIATAMAGAWMLRRQGLAVLAKAQTDLENGIAPVREVFDGVFLLLAGCLLLTPGFVTDTLGGLLFIPPLRLVLARIILRRLLQRADVSVDGQRRWYDGGDDGVIDGEFEEVRRQDPASERPGRLLPRQPKE